MSPFDPNVSEREPESVPEKGTGDGYFPIFLPQDFKSEGKEEGELIGASRKSTFSPSPVPSASEWARQCQRWRWGEMMARWMDRSFLPEPSPEPEINRWAVGSCLDPFDDCA